VKLKFSFVIINWVNCFRSHNEIQHVDCSTLWNATTLKSLDLNNNHLVDISVASFRVRCSIQSL